MSHVPHECRHTFETRLDSAGANWKCIDLLMGHVSKDTGNRVYNHKIFDELTATVELIQDWRSSVQKLNWTLNNNKLVTQGAGIPEKSRITAFINSYPFFIWWKEVFPSGEYSAGSRDGLHGSRRRFSCPGTDQPRLFMFTWTKDSASAEFPKM